MPHTSTGTVRLTTHVVPPQQLQQIQQPQQPPASGQNNSVVFVPDHDHSAQNDERRHATFTDVDGVNHQLPVQDGERRHAVFFDEGGVNHQVWVLDPDIGGVHFALPSGNQAILAAAQAAATTGTKVKIRVDYQNYWVPTITSITIPA